MSAHSNNVIPVDLEVPQDWFESRLDGGHHRHMFSTLCAAIAKRPLGVQMRLVPFGSYAVPRKAPDGGFTISYHSAGDAANVWRIKETSIFGHHSFDAMGYSGWSSLALRADEHRARIERIDTDAATTAIESLRLRLKARNLSKYVQPGEPFSPPGRYVFMPLQLLDDPVSAFARIDHLAVLRRAAEVAKSTGRYLIVKRHPLCRNAAVELALREAGEANPFMRVTQASIHPLIESSDAVLVANSGVGMEALVYGKPVFTFAASEYELATKPISTIEDVAAVFADKHNFSASASTRFLHYYLTECCFEAGRPETAAKSLDRAIAALGIAPSASSAPVPIPSVQPDLETAAELEAARRQLLRAQHEIDALKRANTEAAAAANELAATLRANQSAGPNAAGQAAALDIGLKLHARASAAISAENGLAAIARDAFSAYAGLAESWRATGAPIGPQAAELLRSGTAAAANAGASIRNITKDAYQALHDKDPGYQANNWLVDHVETIAAARPRVIAEVGCGNGRFVKAIAPRVERVLALDWARSPLLDPLPANAEFRATNVLTDEIPPADLCCSADVLEHFEPVALPSLIQKLNAAAPLNYHVIACYDDGHSHLSVLHPGQWLALFRIVSPAYRIAAVIPRRGRPDQVVCVISNIPERLAGRPRAARHVGAWGWPGKPIVIHPDAVCLAAGRPVADWVGVDDATIAIRWRGAEKLDFARIDDTGTRIEITNAAGERYQIARLE
jgi:hypothetical protein